MLWLACLIAVRNQRILIAWDLRQHDNARRAAAGLAPHPPPPPALAPQDPHRPGHRRHPAMKRPANPAPLPDHRSSKHTRPADPAQKQPARHAATRKPAQDGNPRETPDPNVNIGAGQR